MFLYIREGNLLKFIRNAKRQSHEILETSGINVFETMKGIEIIIDRHPDIVRKVMIVGEQGELLE